jgi:hypothetical protein
VLHCCFASKSIEPKALYEALQRWQTQGYQTIYKPSGRTLISQPMADMIETPEMEWRLHTLHINRLSPTVERVSQAPSSDQTQLTKLGI